MKLAYFSLQANEQPITTYAEELELLQQQRPRELDCRLPWVLVARCPFCSSPIWMQVGIFSLASGFWFRAYSDGRDEVWEETICAHFFFVDGALNLNGHRPTEAKPWHPSRERDMRAWHYIWMAAEVPFVLPRVLALPGMRAVLHDFPIADGKYAAYPITYFTEQRPPVEDFGIPWARKLYYDTRSGYSTRGKRADQQDFDLERWAAQLFGLDASQPDYPVVPLAQLGFPYRNLAGRKHPYVIREGRVYNRAARPQAGRVSLRFSE